MATSLAWETTSWGQSWKSYLFQLKSSKDPTHLNSSLIVPL